MQTIKRKTIYYTQEEAAAKLDVTVGSIINAVKRGDLEGVRPDLLIQTEDGKIVEGTGLSLSKDLITTESVLAFGKIRKKRKATGRLLKPKKGKPIRAKIVVEGHLLPNGKTEQIFPSETEATIQLEIGKKFLRNRLEDGKAIAGKYIVEVL